MKPANNSSVFFRSSSASSYWSRRNSRTMAGATCGGPRICPVSIGRSMCRTSSAIGARTLPVKRSRRQRAPVAIATWSTPKSRTSCAEMRLSAVWRSDLRADRASCTHGWRITPPTTTQPRSARHAHAPCQSQPVRADVLAISKRGQDVKLVVGGRVSRAVFCADHAPATFYLDTAHFGEGAGGAKPILVQCGNW